MKRGTEALEEKGGGTERESKGIGRKRIGLPGVGEQVKVLGGTVG